MAAISGSIPANLPVLTGKNYENWKIQIRVVMRFQVVLEFVEEGYIPVGERARDQQKDVDRENLNNKNGRHEVLMVEIFT